MVSGSLLVVPKTSVPVALLPEVLHWAQAENTEKIVIATDAKRFFR
jgi:hypothetical protein